MNKSEIENFPVHPEISKVLDVIANSATPLIVGGAVRDWLMGKSFKDLDVEVFDSSWEELISILSRQGRVDLVGKSFGVAKFRAAGIEVDFALPRSELKTADGHRGFSIIHDPALEPDRAAFRRDFTINAISYNWKSRKIVDPLNGRVDLDRRILRHSSDAFAEDPLRVLRGFQFCGRFELKPAPETIQLCREIQGDFLELPRERVWMEWEKWAMRSIRPSLGLRFLQSTGWLDHFSEISALVNCPQDPFWHPEGDVFNHTCHCVDALVNTELYQNSDRFERLTLMFSVLAHDFGKPETTVQIMKEGKQRWISPAHDRAGIPLAESFLSKIGAPLNLIPRVQALVGNHMASLSIQRRPSLPHVRRLARRVMPASLEQLFAVIRSDLAGRPPLPAKPGDGLLWLEEAAKEEALLSAAPKPLVLGRHLINRGLRPGPHFKTILNELFERQLDGAFSNLEEAEPFISELCDPPVK